MNRASKMLLASHGRGRARGRPERRPIADGPPSPRFGPAATAAAPAGGDASDASPSPGPGAGQPLPPPADSDGDTGRSVSGIAADLNSGMPKYARRRPRRP
jgi:hypothetical protein